MLITILNNITMPVAQIIKNLIWAGVITYIFYNLLPSIIDFISKLKKLSFKDIAAELGDTHPESVNEKAPESTANLQSAFEMDKYYQNPVISEAQDFILNFIKTSNLPDSEKLRMIIKDLASAQVEVKMLRISLLIYPEQIELLNYLNTNQPVPLNYLKKFYDNMVSKKDLQSLGNYESFIDFLKQSMLISVDEANNCLITIFGREYLAYRITQALPIMFNNSLP